MNKLQAEEWVAARKVTDREYWLLDEVIHGKVRYIDGVLYRQPQVSAVPWPCCESDRYMLSRLLCQDLIELRPRSRYDDTAVHQATADGQLYHILRRALDSEATARS
jgi:hypothetical protein